MERIVQLIVDGKTYEMPIISGSEGENTIPEFIPYEPSGAYGG